MTRTSLLASLALGLLTAALLAVPSAAADKPLTADDKAKLDLLEKQIADLQKQKEMIQTPEAKPTPSGPAVPEGTLPDSLAKAYTWRQIGPANMGGRVTAIAVHDADPTTYYVATGGGGLLKTVNNGTTFDILFDKQSTVAIGDVAIAKSNPNIVWVGTGEANPRNSVGFGDGAYKSTDAGKTWQKMGLDKTFQIGKILIHPTNPEIVYVGALGRLYGPSEDRGMYKTTDGGKTWAKVLYVDDKTGVIDARLDPQDPETVIAALWERKRDEFDGFFGEAPVPDAYGPIVTHGTGGGLFKSTDGGKTWKKLTDDKLNNGLPTGKLGRIGLDYSAKTKGLLVAIIDTDKVGTGTASAVYLGVIGVDAENDGGAKLNEITEGGPAGKAGLKPGDIVTKIGDAPVLRYDDLLDAIYAKAVGDKLTLTVKRGDKTETIELTLGKRDATTPSETAGGRKGPKKDAPAKDAPKDAPAKDAPPAAAEPTGPAPILGVQMGGDRLVVNAVAKDGPAAKAGLKVGDTILFVDGKKVEDFAAYLAALRERKPGDAVKVVVGRNNFEKTFTVTLGAPVAGKGPPETPPVAKETAKEPAKDAPPAAAAPPKAGTTTAPTGPPRGATTTRPNGLGLGGQAPNVQARQGKDGYQTGGIFVSKDNGDTWTRVNSLNPRPMYFSVVRFDPTDDNTIYALADVPVLYKSTNGGKRFATVPTSNGVHADAHALYVNPANPKHLIIGCDGGFYASYDKALTWDHLNTLALGQFYHVATDNRRPYRVYGGLQDNGSWGGPSQTMRRYGHVNEDWVFVSGGDGFVCRVDPTDPDLVYAESQNGFMSRRNFRTGEFGAIRPPRTQTDEPLRFNWNTPFILSNHNPSIFYCGAQFVFRSVSKGANLKQISPDLTKSKKGSLTQVCESPRTPDVLWAGSDDGNVWVTKDGGAKWDNVTDNFKAAGLPGPRWVSCIEPSHDKDGRCYVVFDGHRSDDDKPYAFVTTDFGATWKSVAANLPAFGSTRVLREDTVNSDVLYLGTEFGAFVSTNRGAQWAKLGGNLPTVRVDEFAQPTTANDLVVATHGRSIWIADVTSLRQMKSSVMAADATLFAPSPAVRWKLGVGGESPYSSTDRKFVGVNPARGATVEYLLTKDAKKLALKVLDVNGKTVKSFDKPKTEPGLHRVVWDLTGPAANPPAGGGRRVVAGSVPPGMYKVVLTIDDKEFTQSLVVELDPNAPRDAVTLEGFEDDDAAYQQERRAVQRPKLPAGDR